jgi:hypothetical protein
VALAAAHKVPKIARPFVFMSVARHRSTPRRFHDR